MIEAILGLVAGAAGTRFLLGLDRARPLERSKSDEHVAHPPIADKLNWSTVPFPGVVQQKDMSWLAGFRFSGPDAVAAPNGELNRIADRVAEAVARLTDDWIVHVDLYRRTAVGYAPCGAFPEAALRALDEERRLQYETDGTRWESECFVTIAYRPARQATRWLGRFFATGGVDELSATEEWERFRSALLDFEDRLVGVLRLQRLSSEELLAHLYRTLTGRRQYIMVPYHGAGLDVILGHEIFVGDFAPVLGDSEVRVVGFQGYPPSVRPTILRALTEQPMEYRWSSRIRPLSPESAEGRLRQTQREHYEKRQGARSFAAEMVRGKDDPGNPEWARMQENEHARTMAKEVSEAIALNSTANVRYCEFNSYLVLHRASVAEAEADARAVIRILRDHGFTAQVETIHSMEAFLGTLPGHGEPNVQRPLLSTDNIAAILPLAAAWAGPERNPCQYYPRDSPPLFWGDTDGATPFRVCLHSADVGHTLVIGPTGAGKSTILQHVAAQAFRYPEAQVFVLDRGRSFELLCRAAGGDHVDLTPGLGGLALQPLARVEDPFERAWAMDWLELLLRLQGVELTPIRREALNRVLGILALDAPQHRTLTDFVTQVSAADRELGMALEVYTVTGPYGGILDGETDVLSTSPFLVYEMEGLLDLSEAITLPVLSVVLHRLERRFNGRPTYLIVDEAKASLAHPYMARKGKEYAVTVRKKNVVLVLAFQDLHQLAELDSYETIMSSCPTRIFLPNSEACSERERGIYESAGLNEQEIRLLAASTPKRHYYFKNPAGARRFELALGATARAFYFAREGLNVDATLTRAAELQREFGTAWTIEWLREAGAEDAAANLELVLTGG